MKNDHILLLRVCLVCNLYVINRILNLSRFITKFIELVQYWIYTHLISSLYVQRAESARDRTQLLNPMVEVTADSDDVDNKPDDFFKKFDVICAVCCKPTQLYRINTICSDNKIKFYCGDVFGYYGYMFSDLGFHEYAEYVYNILKFTNLLVLISYCVAWKGNI